MQKFIDESKYEAVRKLLIEFRDYVLANATQWKNGSAQHNVSLLWNQIAEYDFEQPNKTSLSASETNKKPTVTEAIELLKNAFFVSNTLAPYPNLKFDPIKLVEDHIANLEANLASIQAQTIWGFYEEEAPIYAQGDDPKLNELCELATANEINALVKLYLETKTLLKEHYDKVAIPVNTPVDDLDSLNRRTYIAINRK